MMATLKVEITIDRGSVMVDDPEAETAAILSRLAADILVRQLGNIADGVRLFDANGNSVGRAWVAE
jgi:hypothetical protein